ncbi:MAG TPA: PPC domain-containing DNA-binding protein [Aurantimonas sp.]|nr:PPC domain-containing DNA-binding protein [Aurantimonas sp.]
MTGIGGMIMRSRILSKGARTTYILVFEEGEEVLKELSRFASHSKLDAAEFTGLGALSEAVLGFWDVDAKDYHRIPVREQVEVLSFVGNITTDDGEAKVHPHIVLAKRDGTAHGGHLLEARVRPTLEVVVTEAPAHLKRRHDAATGLPLIDLGA